MTSSAIQARINAFEALQSSTSAPPGHRSPPNLLETPISPTASRFSPIFAAPSNPSPSPSPPNLGRKTSLIDLKDWVVEGPPLPYVPRKKPSVNGSGKPPLAPKPTPRHVSDSHALSKFPPKPPLINLESPPKPRAAPPLPPRKPSYSSLKSVGSNSSSSSLPHTPPTAIPLTPTRSDSLTVDYTYPPSAKLGITIPSRHVPASSISSFHSVSLSSDGGTDPSTPGIFDEHVATYPLDHDDHGSLREPDAISLNESFENLSISSAISPSVSSVSYDWEHFPKRSEPPKLPQRPTKPPSSIPNSPSHSPLLAPKRDAPPPPPPRSRPPSSQTFTSASASASDRSSILSTTTSHTSFSTRSSITSKGKSPQLSHLSRPTPVPPAARKRYEKVFNGNIIAARQAERARSPPPGRKQRQAAGWRGLSVDLITDPTDGGAPPTERIEEPVGPDERLDGAVIKVIWKLSRLERATLRLIWTECDPAGTGSLDRDAFVRGMWRIDEELRKVQHQKKLSSGTPYRLHVRQPRPALPPRPILR